MILGIFSVDGIEGSMEYSLFFGVCFFCIVGTANTSNEIIETNHKNCLTWQDDPEWLHLICRVTNFVLPVTFVHMASNTEVKCKISKDKRGCFPEEKKVTIDEYNDTVTLLFSENKSELEKYLVGNWTCKQGNSTYITEVSFTKGLIIDPSIYLRGTVGNDNRYLNLECGSCRIPIGPFIEIQVNGETEGSFRQTDQQCWYNDILCSNSKICKCSETQNGFSLRLQLPNVSRSTNISCYMLFYDIAKDLTFSVIANYDFKGKDFEVTGNKIKVIHSNPNPTVNDDASTHRTKVVQSTSLQPTQTSTAAKTIPSDIILDNVETEKSPALLVIKLISATLVCTMLILCYIVVIVRRLTRRAEKLWKCDIRSNEEKKMDKNYKNVTQKKENSNENKQTKRKALLFSDVKINEENIVEDASIHEKMLNPDKPANRKDEKYDFDLHESGIVVLLDKYSDNESASDTSSYKTIRSISIHDKPGSFDLVTCMLQK